MAIAEGKVLRNPALLLFTPKTAIKPIHRAMTVAEVRQCFAALDQRERLIAKLSILAEGWNPAEFVANYGLREESCYLHGSVVRPIHNLHARPMKNGYASRGLFGHVTHSLGHRLSMRWFDSQSDQSGTDTS